MKNLLTLALVIVAASATAAPRLVTPFNEGWTADGERVTLPHTWNATDGADGTPEDARDEKYLDWKVNPASTTRSYARKAVAYRNTLPDPKPGRRYFFRCQGASITAEVYVNDTFVGRHLGAYTAFCYEITDALKAKDNRIIVFVDNRFNRDIPTFSADFTIFGGIYRGCELIETDAVCIDPTYYGGSGVELKIDSAKGHVTARVHVLGGPDETREFDFPGFELWSPENPKLYSVEIALANGDRVSETFGFRTAEFDAGENFLLNGQPRLLKGVCRHQDRKGKGWAVSAADEEEDVRLIKAMGADAVRTAHYPQSENFYDLLDREGLIAWCETPVTDTLTPSVAYRAVLETMCREMVVQLGHHPSICMWSIYNEIQNTWSWAMRLPTSACLESFDYQKAIFGKEDGTRPIVAATCWNRELEINASPTALGLNIYPGWYAQRAEEMGEIVERTCATNHRAKIAISEYGAGGNPNHHEWPAKRISAGGPFHPEEYQFMLHRKQYECLVKSPRLWGTFIWNMFDFAADTRNEGSTPGMNDKGLVTYDRQTKKEVYYFYQANWTKQPVLRLIAKDVGVVHTNRLPVVAISNVGPVTLVVNGKTIATAEPDVVKCAEFRDVPLDLGANTIEVRSGGKKLSAVWTRDR